MSYPPHLTAGGYHLGATYIHPSVFPTMTQIPTHPLAHPLAPTLPPLTLPSLTSMQPIQQQQQQRQQPHPSHAADPSLSLYVAEDMRPPSPSHDGDQLSDDAAEMEAGESFLPMTMQSHSLHRVESLHRQTSLKSNGSPNAEFAPRSPTVKQEIMEPQFAANLAAAVGAAAMNSALAHENFFASYKTAPSNKDVYDAVVSRLPEWQQKQFLDAGKHAQPDPPERKTAVRTPSLAHTPIKPSSSSSSTHVTPHNAHSKPVAPQSAPALSKHPVDSEAERIRQLKEDERMARRMAMMSDDEFYDLQQEEEEERVASKKRGKKRAKKSNDSDEEWDEGDLSDDSHAKHKRTKNNDLQGIPSSSPSSSSKVQSKETAASRARGRPKSHHSPMHDEDAPSVSTSEFSSKPKQLEDAARSTFDSPVNDSNSKSSSQAAIATIYTPPPPGSAAHLTGVPPLSTAFVAAAAAASAASASNSAKPFRSTGSLLWKDRAHVYRLCEAACSGNVLKKACADNPHCLHGCGYKMKVGMWAKVPTQLKALGIDPATRKRDGHISHAGLKNLGALCYMNTLFQVLFMNQHFRNAIYRFRSALQRKQEAERSTDVAITPSLQSEEDQDKVVSELQYLFARLEFGRASFEDPRRIVQALGLAHGEQQDVNEFNNLFMSLIESRLKKSSIPGLTTLIDDEFKGTIVHSIQCSKCGTRSETKTSFYDLTLQISKLKTVHQAMVKHMQKEEMSGTNKYKCYNCGLVDAERTSVLDELPPVLNLQLLRFGYDHFTETKKKLQENISIPAIIDLTPFRNEEAVEVMAQELASQIATNTLPPNGVPSTAAQAATIARSAASKPSAAADVDDSMDCSLDPAPILPLAGDSNNHAFSSSSSSAANNKYRYELTAILRHKGTSAHHGHYIADIRDPLDHTRWWRFDDDSCTPLLQFDDGQPAAVFETNAKGEKVKKKKGGKKKKSVEDEDEEGYDYESKADKDRAKRAREAVVVDDDDSEEDDEEAEADAADGDATAAGAEEDVMIVDHPHSKTSAPAGSIDNICSRNAYMLVYTRSGRAPAQPVKSVDLTPEMKAQVDESDRALLQQIEQYKRSKERVTMLIETRKALANDFINLDVDPVKADKRLLRSSVITEMKNSDCSPAEIEDALYKMSFDQGVFVSMQWLYRWMTGVAMKEEKKHATVKADPATVIDLSDALDTKEEESETKTESPAAPAAAATTSSSSSTAAAMDTSPSPAPVALPVVDTTRSSPSATSTAANSNPVSIPPLSEPMWPGDFYESYRSLLCEHGKLKPHNPDLRRVSLQQYAILSGENQMQKHQLNADKLNNGQITNPPPPPAPHEHQLDSSSVCDECCQVVLKKEGQFVKDRTKRDALYDAMLKFKDMYPGGADLGGFPDQYYISKKFLRAWTTKAQNEIPNSRFTQASEESDINDSLKCQHTMWNTDDKARIIISKDLWTEFKYFYPASSTFAAMDNECPDCLQVASRKDAAAEASDARFEIDQKAKLFQRKVFTNFPLLSKPPQANAPSTFPYFVLLPGRWARQWKDHAERRTSHIPPPLQTVELICDHGKLKFNPIPHDFHPVVPLPPPYDVPGCKEGDVAVCEPQFWETLVRDGRYFSNIDQDAIKVELVLTAKVHSPFDSHDWNRFIVKTNYEPCKECIEKREAAEKLLRVTWEAGCLYIKVMQPGCELPEDVAGPSPSIAAAGRPRRTRKTKTANADILTEFESTNYSSSDLISKLKLEVFQYSDVPPGQQVLWFQGKELKDTKSFADLEIPADAEIWVTRNLDGDPDTSAFFADVKRNAEPEAGFAGTALSSTRRSKAAGSSSTPVVKDASPPAAAAEGAVAAGGPTATATPRIKKWPCKACTFENSHLFGSCEMCGTKK